MRFGNSVVLLACLFAPLQAQVVVSQVYGGGGNSGATLKNDFIELFNRGAATVDLSTYSVQYASSTGSSWSKTNLTGSIGAGQYYLVQEAQGAGGTDNLPTPDATGTIAMSGTAGKVVLVSDQNTITSGTVCPAGTNIIDIVGYGTGTNCFEGSGPTATLSNTTAAIRAGLGCTDTANNATDFALGAPAPRNIASPTNACGSPGQVTIITSSLPNAYVSLAYGAVLTASGGSGAYTWTVVGGALPDGLSLSPSGAINGVPTIMSVYNFRVRATDSGNNSNTAEKDLSITVTTFSCPTSHTISQIQGTGSTSPLAGQLVTTRGIVTAKKSNGFFLQMATGDGDPNTSDGVFVFTSSAPTVSVGNDACVSATVAEFIPSSDPSSPPLTELANVTVGVMASGQPLPAPVVLTSSDTNPAGGLDVLERFEGMRVSIPQLLVVGPTQGTVTESSATSTSNGVFYGVIPGISRPFREPGVEVPDPLPAGSPPNVPRFDGNPEKIRVDSDAQPGTSAIDVTAGATVSGLTGTLDYGFRTYTIDPDPGVAPTVSGNVSFTAVPVPASTELTIACINLERFFDTTDDPTVSDVVLTQTAYNNRINKAILLLRNVMQTPDVIGVEEMENATTLQDLATKLNTAAGTDYVSYLVEGNDIGGIDVGFLVKASRVSGLTVTQQGKDTTYTDPSTGQPALLNDRPPLVLSGKAKRAGAITEWPFTVVVNHLRSLNGIDDSVDGNRVRVKRQQQAEYLANLVQPWQAADPKANIILVGDFNAFEFSDGYVDLIGTIKGTPAPADTVVLASPDLVNPDFTELLATATATERYSYNFDGSAQALDHILVSTNALARLSRFAGGRVDADFPEIYRNDPNRPERLSDHDPLVSYYTLPADKDVTSMVKVNSTPALPDRDTGLWSNVISVRSKIGTTIAGPVWVVLEDLTPGVTVVNPTGMLDGKPYVEVAPKSGLTPDIDGIDRFKATVQYSKTSSNLPVTFTPRVLASGLNP